MNRWLLASLFAAAMLLSLIPTQAEEPKEGEWTPLFNGKDLTGWKPHPSSPGMWSVEGGCIVGRGKVASHLFSEKGDYENFHYRIVAKISDKGNSGQYFRTQFGPGYPKGYEAQINATFPDPQKTGSLYNFVKITEKLHEPDEWFTQEVIAEGNRIQIILNGKKTADYKDEKNTHTKGHFAFQQHGPAAGGPDSMVTIKKAEVKLLK